MLVGPVLDIMVFFLEVCGKTDLWFWVRTADLAGIST